MHAVPGGGRTTRGARWRQVVARSPDVVSRSILDEPLLVPIRGHLADLQCLYSLGGAGGFIWEQIDGQRDLGRILEALVSRYDGPEELLAGDLLEFVAVLEEAGLVTQAS